MTDRYRQDQYLAKRVWFDGEKYEVLSATSSHCEIAENWHVPRCLCVPSNGIGEDDTVPENESVRLAEVSPRLMVDDSMPHGTVQYWNSRHAVMNSKPLLLLTGVTQ